MLSFSGPLQRELLANFEYFIVTGAGGWLGRAALEMLDDALGDRSRSRIFAFASAHREYLLRSGRRLSILPLGELARRNDRSALVFHFAYLGKEKVSELGIDVFTQTNRMINAAVENYCRRLLSGGLFFASSGAAHFAKRATVDLYREPYGTSKIEDEPRFFGLARPAFPVAVCRIFNMAGPFINKVETYALSCILCDILAGRTISLRAERLVFRSYVHVRDIVELATQLVVRNACPRTPYDTVGSEIIEVGELAVRCAATLGRNDLEIQRPRLLETSEDRYVGDGVIFQALTREAGIELASLDKQILDTAAFLKSHYDHRDGG